MTTEQTFVCLLIVGCLPWHFQRYVKRLRLSHRYVRQVEVQVNAVFWRLVVIRRGGRTVTVHIRIPLIQRIQDAIWAALHQVIK